MKNNSKITYLVLFMVPLLFAYILFFSIIFFNNDSFVEHQKYNLIGFSELNSKRISNYFYDTLITLNSLSKTDFTRELFTRKLEYNLNSVHSDVNEFSKITTKEIQNYLINNEKNSTELVNNPQFRNLALKKIGENGYTAIYVLETGKILVHTNKELEGKSLEEIVSQEFLDMRLDLLNGSKSSESFYTLNLENESLYKFAKSEKILTKTKDNLTLVLVSTALVDDYSILSNISKEENNFLNRFYYYKGYDSLLLVNSFGKIIYDSDTKGYNGIYVTSDFLGLKQVYLESKEKNSSSVYGPVYYNNGDKEILSFVYFIPSFMGDVFLGDYVVIVDANKVYNLMEDPNFLAEHTLSFLLNKDGLLASPIENSSEGILLQQIRSENTKHCIEGSYEIHTRDGSFTESFNFYGDLIFGTHSHIKIPNLCFLTEMNRQKLIDETTSIKKNYDLYLLFLIAFFIFIFIYIVSNKLSKKYILVNNEELFFPRLKKINYLTYSFILILFLLIYFFLLGYFMGGYNKSFLENSIDLVTVFLSGLLIKFSLQRNYKKHKLVFFGAFLIFFEKLGEILLQQYESYLGGIVYINTWAGLIIILFIGLIFLLEGFGGNKKWK